MPLYAEIIPVKRLSRTLGIFDYLVPSDLERVIRRGHLVSIPFRKRLSKGIVFCLKNESAIPSSRLKNIERIAHEDPFLTSAQFDLLNTMSEDYFCSPSILVGMMIPKVPQRKKKEEVPLPRFPLKIEKTPRTTPSWTRDTKNSFSQTKKSALFVAHHDFMIRMLDRELLRDTLLRQQTVLIIVPDTHDLEIHASAFQDLLEEKQIAVITSKLRPDLYFQKWNNVMRGETRVVIGTRLALFLPFRRLDLIVVHHEEDTNHKQEDQNPRYHARDIAFRLASLYGAKLLLTSHAPSLEMMEAVKKERLTLLPHPPFPKRQARIVDLQEEWKVGRFSSVSRSLERVVRETMAKKQSIFLFINRRGFARILACADCGWIANCPTCSVPSSIPRMEILSCPSCHHEAKFPTTCPHCEGFRLRSRGRAIQAVEEELRKLFPKIPVLRVDKDQPARGPFRGIILGTEYALPRIDTRNIGAVGVISSDPLLYVPDFRIEEKNFQLLLKLLYWTPRIVPVIFQTLAPNHRSIIAASSENLDLFYKEEARQRRNLRFPPAVRLMKLIFQHPSATIAKKETQRLSIELRSRIHEHPEIDVSEPLPSFPAKIRKQYRWILLIKASKQLPTPLQELLKKLPSSWIIDPSPSRLT